MIVRDVNHDTAAERLEVAESAVRDARAVLEAVQVLGLDDERYYVSLLEEVISKVEEVKESCGELVDREYQEMIAEQNRDYVRSVL